MNAEGRCLSGDPFAMPTSIVLAYGEVGSGRSPPASLGFDRNTPTFWPINPTKAFWRSGLGFGKPRVGLLGPVARFSRAALNFNREALILNRAALDFNRVP